MALENLKLSEDRSQVVAKELKILDEKTSTETVDLAKNAIAWLDNAKLATFIETQFKAGDKRKSFSEMKENTMYTFAVQAALDALGYDALLTGGDTTFGIDEVYGSRTKAAVKKFQEDMGLAGNDVDGIVWEKTFVLMSQKLRSIAPVVVNKTNNPKFGPVESPFIDGETPNWTNIEQKKPLYTSLSEFIDSPLTKLPLYKSDVLVDYHGMKKSIWWVVLQIFNKPGRTESSVLRDYDLYKNYVVWDPVLSAYILYKSMQWLGTYNKVVDKIIADNKSTLPSIFKAFGIVDNQDLIDYLVGDFGWSYSDYLDRSALQKYLTLFRDSSPDLRTTILSKTDLRDKSLYSQFLAHTSKYPQWNTIA